MAKKNAENNRSYYALEGFMAFLIVVGLGTILYGDSQKQSDIPTIDYIRGKQAQFDASLTSDQRLLQKEIEDAQKMRVVNWGGDTLVDEGKIAAGLGILGLVGLPITKWADERDKCRNRQSATKQ